MPRNSFPLIQLPKKFKALVIYTMQQEAPETFPLIQLPKKFKVRRAEFELLFNNVSINSTSEEV